MATMFDTSVPDVDFGASPSMLDLAYESYSMAEPACSGLPLRVPDDLLSCSEMDHTAWGMTPPDSPVHSQALDESVSDSMMLGFETQDSLDLSVVSEKLASFECVAPYDWSSPPASPVEGVDFSSPDAWASDATPPASPVPDMPSTVCDDLMAFPADGIFSVKQECTEPFTPASLTPAPLAAAPAVRAAPSKRKSGAKDEESRRRSRAKRIADRESRTADCDAAVLTLTQSKADLEDPETRRHCHNVLERKRRNDLKNSYQMLHEALPSLEDRERAPTGQILLHAVDYVVALKAEEAQVVQAIAGANTENQRLKTLLGLPL